MAVRTGTISESAKRDIQDATKVIINDVLEDGGSKGDAIRYIRKLVMRAAREVKD